MEHPGALLGVVLGAVGEPEALGHVEVHLHGGALPGAADGVLHLDVDLRAVERAVALVDVVGQAVALACFLERVCGMLPHVVGADGLLGTRGDLGLVFEPERGHDMVHEPEDGHHLVHHLVARAEHVRVVLGEAARAQQAVHDATHLVAVHRAELEVAQRQVTVGMQLALVEHHVARAVHGLHGVLGHAGVLVVALVDLEEVHVLLVEAVMARGLPHVGVVDVRGDDLLVAARVKVAAQPLLQGADDARALGEVQRQTGARQRVHDVDAQLAPQLAVVALLGLLQVAHVLVQLLLLEERRAVDAGEHLTLGVAAPVRAGELRDLERAQFAGGGQVRPAAEVGELADGVRGDDGVLGKLGDELKLERLIREDLLGLGARDHAALEGLVGLHYLGHAGLDGGEVVGRERAARLHVVIEAALDGRSHAELHVAVEVDERGSHYVRRGMA